MKSISILIKPASGCCNLNCRYCFYHDEMKKREVANYGFMSEETSRNLIDKFLSIPDLAYISCAFQGGEPTLRGLSFFKDFVSYASKKAHPGISVQYSIQTNGILLDENWASFFKENHFLVGISLDGYQEIHDTYRLDKAGKGSFAFVKEKIELLKQYHIDFNILSVVTKDSVKHMDEIYSFFEKNSFVYQQYIPCLDPLNENKGEKEYSLSPEDYLLYLNTLFENYYASIRKGQYVYNRTFENYILAILGENIENCNMVGHCSIQYVIEGNGDVYPCDFYVVDRYLLGNINNDSIANIDKKRWEKKFLQDSTYLDEKCKTCHYLGLCRSGCRRDKEYGDKLGRNYYCQAFYDFFKKNLPRLELLAKLAEIGKFPKPKI